MNDILGFRLRIRSISSSSSFLLGLDVVVRRVPFLQPLLLTTEQQHEVNHVASDSDALLLPVASYFVPFQL